ncbi:MAG: type I glyceraldehyde-3-phosphate dehydrogenase [Kordiimonadales bacterium]|nr:MAG: type I glyceraldehyde-3-phosphate dehydrogenase [Kordiimonadales bacterium]
MTVRVSINGFGRIGRNVLRAIYESGRDDIRVVAINDLGDVEMNAYLLKRDSVHGHFAADVQIDGDYIVVNGDRIRVTAIRNPAELPWGEENVDVAMECTGIFTAREKAAMHIEAGAKKVLISAPGSNSDRTVVFGVNSDELTADDVIVSNASCTTNCLSPVAQVLNDLIGIERGYMTTIHAYTGDQPVLDTLHSDPRRARAAAMSMIPTSTGAAKAVGLVLPELAGKLHGSAIRVPTPNVSLVDLKFDAGRDTSVEEINGAIKAAAEGKLKGILGYEDMPAVSIDFNHNPNSSTFDSSQTAVIDGRFVRILTWYDNEWGFSNRMSDTAVVMAKLG